MFARIADWSRRNMPTRETFERIRFLRPVAHRILLPELWRFNRRSVPRGVALGMLVGVLIPVAQTVFAALFALPARANVPVAALTTFITNPFTTPPIWIAAYWIGSRVWVADVVAQPPSDQRIETSFNDWLHWLLSDAAPATAIGLVVIAVIGAALGYLLAAFFWRFWIGHKWRARGRNRSIRGH
ncbi:DUF2062 domain-containing protein [Sphingomonas jatrophae]|uniref:DUF2062 domain-containing protein n=1 Tax=Sphingomonas jatrophae TaxID=1166337 RepID=A0A1I6M346_9SPHN|nr:DUF2062 domain-containing protein [Sphingomonas jatrophae]SFS10101.1 hypothetical protein SAMN05192580_3369 [Sphingomonas jatrophae]